MIKILAAIGLGSALMLAPALALAEDAAAPAAAPDAKWRRPSRCITNIIRPQEASYDEEASHDEEEELRAAPKPPTRRRADLLSSDGRRAKKRPVIGKKPIAPAGWLAERGFSLGRGDLASTDPGAGAFFENQRAALPDFDVGGR